MGSSTKSGTPTETRDATGHAGNTFGSLFAPGGEQQGIEDIFSRLGSMTGKLGTEAQHNYLGFGAGDLDLMSAAQASLNPKRFDATSLFDLLSTQRERGLTTAQRGAASTAGTAGMRFSGAADRAVRDVTSEVTRGYDIADQQLLATENARVQELQLEAFSQIATLLGNMGLAGTDQIMSILGPIMQFIAPGEPIYDPGMGRDIAAGLAGGAGTAAGIYAGGKL